MERRDNDYYEARAQDVKLEDVTSSAQNAEILRRVRDNLALIEGGGDGLIIADCEYDDQNTFVVKEGDEWGWVGYFIGRSKQIRYLHVYHLPEEDDEIDAFMKGMSCNRSIEELYLNHEIDGGLIIQRLAPFIVHNSKLKQLRLLYVDIEFDCARTLAMALKKRQEKTLTSVSLCNLSNDALAELIDALRGYKQLNSLFVKEDLAVRDEKYYEMLAPIIDLRRITSSEKNAEILRRLRDDEWDEKQVLTVADYDYEDEGFFCYEGDDCGWLGYFIGRSKQIRNLHLYYLFEENTQNEAFIKGMSRNRSIEELDLSRVNEGGPIIDSLAPFIMNNSNLKQLLFEEVDIDFDCAQSLSKAFKGRQQKSLTSVSLCRNNLSNDALAEIIDALSGYKQLKSLLVKEELVKRDEKYYEMLAPIIDLRRITSSEKNAEILRKLRDNVWDEKQILTVVGFIDHEYFCIDQGDDWGWLGYFIGKNIQIRELCVCSCLPEQEDKVSAFMKGLNRNRSIERFQIMHEDINFGSLSSFFMNNSNLRSLEVEHGDIGLENARILALALTLRQEKSLSRFRLSHNNLSNDALAEITAALSTYTSLETFSISENPLIGWGGCVSLGSIIRPAALHLKGLFLQENNFDDGGLQILAAALTNAANLRQLSLSGNRSITATGLRELSRVFHYVCSLETLYLEGMNIADEGAEALKDGLVGNTTLKHLVVSPDLAGITNVGWSAFSRLLCDTSSINNTYRSNHTLEHIGDDYCYVGSLGGGKQFHSNKSFRGIPPDIIRCMKINITCRSHQSAAKVKIVMCNPDIPVEVFFQHKLKFLPLIVSWFAGFGTRNHHNFQVWRESQRRELAAVYKFVRGMPLLAVGGHMILKSNSGRKRKYDE